jgi:6-phosphogluconolactonase (cycloisomerase 2 family)
MRRVSNKLGVLLSLLGLSVAACGNGAAEPSSPTPVPDLQAPPDLTPPQDQTPPPDLTPPPPQVAPRAVYTMSNDVTDNKIFVYLRAADGALTPGGAYSTGGRGTAAGLGSQNSLIFDEKKNLFFAVNAGDSSISMLSLRLDGSLALLSHVPSGGVRPVSIAVSGDTVYALNAGDSMTGSAANISGFQISAGSLVPIQNSIKPLSAANPGPAQIQFTADGKTLVVTERMSNTIDTFVLSGGVPGSIQSKPSAGMTPFGFAFSADQQLIVSEAASGSASSYALLPGGALSGITSALVSGQRAPCWTVVVRDIAYMTNAQTNNISAYKIARNGSLTLLSGGVAATTGMGPTDEDVTDEQDFLYVLNSRERSFSVFAVGADGALSKKPDYAGLPMTPVGVVAR